MLVEADLIDGRLCCMGGLITSSFFSQGTMGASNIGHDKTSTYYPCSVWALLATVYKYLAGKYLQHCIALHQYLARLQDLPHPSHRRLGPGP